MSRQSFGLNEPMGSREERSAKRRMTLPRKNIKRRFSSRRKKRRVSYIRHWIHLERSSSGMKGGDPFQQITAESNSCAGSTSTEGRKERVNTPKDQKRTGKIEKVALESHQKLVHLEINAFHAETRSVPIDSRTKGSRMKYLWPLFEKNGQEKKRLMRSNG